MPLWLSISGQQIQTMTVLKLDIPIGHIQKNSLRLEPEAENATSEVWLCELHL